jgi:hypothetical protein
MLGTLLNTLRFIFPNKHLARGPLLFTVLFVLLQRGPYYLNARSGRRIAIHS